MLQLTVIITFILHLFSYYHFHIINYHHFHIITFILSLSYYTFFHIITFILLINITVTAKIIKIPLREFIFRTCEDGAVWHLIPRRISPCSESFFGHIATGILCGG